MSREDDLQSLVAELRGTLSELEAAVGPAPPAEFPRPPRPGDLARFTSEIAIPAALLVLRVNVETLKLLQRLLRMADGRPLEEGTSIPDVGRRTRRVSQAALDRLDDALADLQSSIEGRPPDDEARDLLARARDLRDEVDARLEASAGRRDSIDDAPDVTVPVDVEAELRSLRRAIDEEGNPDDPTDDGSDTAGAAGSGGTGTGTSSGPE